MAKQFITAIWLGKFNSSAELREYVAFNYENEDDVSSKFANDIGLPYFDEDFMESVFYNSQPEILDYLGRRSFVDNKEVLSKVTSMGLGDNNSVISITGFKDRGLVNEELFDYQPVQIEKDYLVFVGLFRGEEHT
ncbi:MAG TPA: immunity 22 family protein [Cyclobacteriaceae bacterium]|nr:immunity 22 family protein [Cyclobacteriaceae bacterium]